MFNYSVKWGENTDKCDAKKTLYCMYGRGLIFKWARLIDSRGHIKEDALN